MPALLVFLLGALGALTPDRQIRFTTSECTWMSVDVSPDGKTIVFDLLGDIYSLPIEGGEAKPLLTGLPFESQPRFSPDGRSLAFLSDRSGSTNLWIARADGSEPRQLSKEPRAQMFSASWMPDGQSILVSVVSPMRQGSAELWRFPVNGAAGEKIRGVPPLPALLVSAPPNGIFGAIPSPDGKEIYFASVTPRVYNSRSGARADLLKRNLQTGFEESVVTRADSAFRPAISPDGKWLAYATHSGEKTGLKLRELATGEERWLKIGLDRDEMEARATRDVLPGYAFTPDGKSVVIGFGGKLHRIEIASRNDREIPFTANVALDAVSRLNFPEKLEQGPVRARIAQRPAISPDGKRIVFSSLTRIYVANPDGHAIRLTSGFEPAWSPDGQWIAYVTWSTQGGQVFKIRSDGGEPRQLTRVPAYYHEPVWSPDGRRIVASRASRLEHLESGPAAHDEIVEISAGGGETKRIALVDGLTNPHFSIDSDRIFLFSPQQGLVSMNLAGGERRVHMKLAAAQQLRISPDGRQVMARAGDQVYLMPVPPAQSTSTQSPATLEDARKLTRFGADSCSWSAGGAMTWALGSSLFVQEAGDLAAREIRLQVETERSIPRGSIVLRGARVITMRGDEIVANADVLITGNRIAAVQKRGAVPAGARIVDVRGMTIIPGLIDIHGHFDAPRNILDAEANPFAANLAYGVTSVRDPQSFSNDIFAYSDLVETGQMIGPRIFSTGPGVFATTNFSSFEETRDAVARYKTYYRTHLLKSYLVGNRQQRQWIVEACRQLGVMPTTEGGAEFDTNLTHALDGFSGNEHALPTAPIYRDVIQLFAQSGITYTPTLLVAFGGPFALYDYLEREDLAGEGKLRRFLPDSYVYNKTTARMLWFPPEAYHYTQVAAGAAAIVKAGGRVAVGGHGELQGLQAHWEMWSLRKGGMSSQEVLRSATLSGAEAIGYAQDLGSLEPGKMADLVVLSKDPLADIRNTKSIRYVMKNGDLFDGDTLDAIWPEKKSRPEPWWFRERP